MNIVPVKRTGALRFSLDWGARLLAGIGLLGWTCALSFAQSGKSLPESLAAPAVMQRADEVRAADLTAQLQAKLAEARLKLGQGTGTNLPPDATPTEALEYQHTLQSLARIYQLRLEDLASLQAAQQRLEDQRLAASAWTGFAEPGPYSVLVVDDLRDNVDTLTVRIEAAATGYKLADTLLAEAKADLAESERKLRLSGEQLETTSRPRADSRLSWDRTLEEVREREATALVGFYQTRRRVFEVGLAENREQQALAQRQLAVASRQVRFARTDLDRVLKNVAAEDREIEEELRAAEAAKEAQDNALTKAREELRQAQTAPPAAPEEAVARAARVRRLQAPLIREKKTLDTHSFSPHSRGIDRSSKSERTMDRPGDTGPAEPTFRRAGQSFPDGAGDGVLSSHRLAGCQRTAEPEQRPCGLAEAGAGRSGAPAADGPAACGGQAAGTR